MKNLLFLLLSGMLLLSWTIHDQSHEILEYTDQRDNNVYTYIKIDDLYWFQENLRYQADQSITSIDTLGFLNCGQFYLIEDALNICDYQPKRK